MSSIASKDRWTVVLIIVIILMGAEIIYLMYQNQKLKSIIDNPKMYFRTLSPDEMVPSFTAYDVDGNETLECVKVKIGPGDWELASGTTSWSYNWDTTTVNDGLRTIYAKSYDGELYSITYTLNVIVDNSQLTADATVEQHYGLINKQIHFFVLIDMQCPLIDIIGFTLFLNLIL